MFPIVLYLEGERIVRSHSTAASRSVSFSRVLASILSSRVTVATCVPQKTACVSTVCSLYLRRVLTIPRHGAYYTSAGRSIERSQYAMHTPAACVR